MKLRVSAVTIAAAILVGCGVDEQLHKKALDDLAACQKQHQQATAQEKELGDKLSLEVNSRKQAEVELASLKTNLKTTEDELADLRKQRAAAEARLAAYRKLNERLQALVDTGKLKVSFRKGQMVLELPAEILFPSGRGNLSKKGKEALAEVADVLSEFKDRRFMIAGHTDNQKIRTPRFPDNWHLSTARAVSVVEFFIDKGFAPENLAAAGYGEFDPVAANDTDEGRAQNRRIEIILVPDLSELPNLAKEPESTTASAGAPSEPAAKPAQPAAAPTEATAAAAQPVAPKASEAEVADKGRKANRAAAEGANKGRKPGAGNKKK